jgi:hypothetical protein
MSGEKGRIVVVEVSKQEGREVEAIPEINKSLWV